MCGIHIIYDSYVTLVNKMKGNSQNIILKMLYIKKEWLNLNKTSDVLV